MAPRLLPVSTMAASTRGCHLMMLTVVLMMLVMMLVMTLMVMLMVMQMGLLMVMLMVLVAVTMSGIKLRQELGRRRQNRE